ncbi:E3 ubiquitin-protein ligase BAH1-like isoform X1 [Ipomoea triloba]|uniref:E3 ubiquitin-protein ligase BAH1-like isoform X1 n=1 Tax=Ipomoea triloba TaxID=35885 RepID=UPI00125D7016|nr:E3 ubiquitin-protein ligase BAH1-like isoform X1 [Ipomoea triloba]
MQHLQFTDCEIKEIKHLLFNWQLDEFITMIHSTEIMKNSSIIHSSMKQMTKIVKHFNTPVHNFLVVSKSLPVSRIFQKHFKFPIRKKLQQQQINPAFCAVMKSKAALRILKKYEKVSNYNGLVNRMFECNTDMQVMMKSSACALELMALQINSKHETKLFDQWLFLADDGPPSLSLTLQDSTVLNVDLTCSICLKETVFDPVSLSCNHIYCYMCACSAASVTSIDGLRSANSNTKCPLCRKESVFGSAVRMKELSIFLSKHLPEYWKERRHKERKARIQEAKEYWESKHRAFVGIN